MRKVISVIIWFVFMVLSGLLMLHSVIHIEYIGVIWWQLILGLVSIFTFTSLCKHTRNNESIWIFCGVLIATSGMNIYLASLVEDFLYSSYTIGRIVMVALISLLFLFAEENLLGVISRVIWRRQNNDFHKAYYAKKVNEEQSSDAEQDSENEELAQERPQFTFPLFLENIKLPEGENDRFDNFDEDDFLYCDCCENPRSIFLRESKLKNCSFGGDKVYLDDGEPIDFDDENRKPNMSSKELVRIVKLTDAFRKKRKWPGVAIAFSAIIVQFVMIAFRLCTPYFAFADGSYILYRLLFTLCSMFLLTVILRFIPFEKMYVFIHDMYIIDAYTPQVARRRRLTTIGVIWALTVGIGVVGRGFFSYHSMFCDDRFACIVMAITMYWLIASFELVESNNRLLILGIIVNTLTGIAIFEVTRSYSYALVSTIALNIAWNVWYFQSDRENRLQIVVKSVIANIVLFLTLGYVYDGFKSFDRWFNPDKYGLVDFIQIQNAHSLNLLSDYKKYPMYHPFSSIYTYLGLIPLLFFIAAFIAMGVAIVKVGKFVLIKRANLMLGIYIWWMLFFVYRLFADLGFAPTNEIPIFALYPHMICICFMLRMLINNDKYELIWKDDDVYECM